MFNFSYWLNCNSSETLKQAKEEIKEDQKRERQQTLGQQQQNLEQQKQSLQIPLTTSTPKPKEPVIPDPFLKNIIGIVFSPLNTDNAKRMWQKLLNDGPNDSDDKAGVLFICRFAEHESIYNLFVQDSPDMSTIEDSFLILQRIPVRRAKYTASLVYTCFNYCQRKRNYEDPETNQIKVDPNWYQPAKELSEKRFRFLIQTICDAVNNHRNYMYEAYPAAIARLLMPKSESITFNQFSDASEEAKKK